MANDALLQSLAGFGTGLMQGFSDQFSTRLEREAEKRQAEWLADLDKRMKDSARQDLAGRLTAAQDARYDYEKENGPLEAPTPESVTSKELFDYTRNRVYERNRPLLETGDVTEARFNKLMEDDFAKEIGKLQAHRNQLLLQASGQFDKDPQSAAQIFAYASNFNQDGIMTSFDPNTGLLVDIDEQTMQRMGEPYQLTQDNIAQQLMSYKNYIARQDAQAREAGIQSRFDANLAQQQAQFEQREARLGAPSAIKQTAGQLTEFHRSAEDAAQAVGLTEIQDKIAQLDEFAAIPGVELPEEQSLQRAKLQEQAQTRGLFARIGQTLLTINREDPNTRPVINLLLQELVDAREARNAGKEPPRGKNNLLVGRDIQVTDVRRATDGTRQVLINGRPLWVADEIAAVIVSTLARAEGGKMPAPSAPASIPAPVGVLQQFNDLPPNYTFPHEAQ